MNVTAVLGCVMCGLALGLASAPAGVIYTYSTTPNATVPDGSPVGITSTLNISGLGNILSSGDNVSVTLNISGANRFNFNADLYAYLSHTYNGNTVTVTLMNTPDGLTGTGMNITLSDTGINGNIQDAVSDTSLSGTYIPSGGSMAFQGYNGMNPNGNWTLFIADIYGEYRATSQTLTSWSLTLDVVPEPVNVALGVFGMLFAVIVVVSRRAKRRI